MLEGLLPIGSVVLLKGATKKLMIVGVVRKDDKNIYDYIAVLYPEGYTSEKELVLFNNENIDKLFSIGFQDEEQFAFKVKADSLLAQVRMENMQLD